MLLYWVSWRQYDAQTILLHEGAGSVLSTKQHCWSIPPHIIDKREKIGGCVGSNAWYGTNHILKIILLQLTQSKIVH